MKIKTIIAKTKGEEVFYFNTILPLKSFVIEGVTYEVIKTLNECYKYYNTDNDFILSHESGIEIPLLLSSTTKTQIYA
jgi:hypothetical protein